MSFPEDTRPEPPMTPDGIPLTANGRDLTKVEIEALREARDRREKRGKDASTPEEIGGAKRSTDPVRYDDWEIGGRAIDFS